MQQPTQPLQQDPLDVPRLMQRVQHYAAKAGASEAATADMVSLLQSGLGRSVLELATDPRLTSLLVNDLYKVRQQREQ